MLLVDGGGLPLSIDVDSARPGEVTLIEPLLEQSRADSATAFKPACRGIVGEPGAVELRIASGNSDRLGNANILIEFGTANVSGLVRLLSNLERGAYVFALPDWAREVRDVHRNPSWFSQDGSCSGL